MSDGYIIAHVYFTNLSAKLKPLHMDPYAIARLIAQQWIAMVDIIMCDGRSQSCVFPRSVLVVFIYFERWIEPTLSSTPSD